MVARTLGADVAGADRRALSLNAVCFVAIGGTSEGGNQTLNLIGSLIGPVLPLSGSQTGSPS
jgi:hypothetical protein